jgi:hypothetical protein
LIKFGKASIAIDALPGQVHPEIIASQRWNSYKIGGEKVTKL